MTPQTMCVTVTIGKFPLMTLIDTESTHNCLHESLAKLVGLPIETDSSLRVIVANGEKLRSPRVCRGVTLNVQNSQFLVDFYLIELEGYDVVLGAQWLKTLGPIIWNFETMEMGFSVGKKEIHLVGIGHSEVKLVSSQMVNKAVEKNKGKGMLLQITLLDY